MFGLCKFKDREDRFILYDKEDFKDFAEQMNMEVEKELSFEEFDKDFSFYPMLHIDDIAIRALNRKFRTPTHVLDELGISSWDSLKKENLKVKEKKSRLSRSERDLVEKHFNFIISLSIPVLKAEE